VAIALVANALMYRIKREVKAHGQKTTWLYGHLIDLYFILILFAKSRNYKYLIMILSLAALIVSFLYVSAAILNDF